MNNIYAVKPSPAGLATHQLQRIQCGEDCHALSAPEDCRIELELSTRINAGGKYHMHKDWFHESIPDNRSISVISRENTKSSEASVVYPVSTGFVEATPRRATLSEIMQILSWAIPDIEFGLNRLNNKGQSPPKP